MVLNLVQHKNEKVVGARIAQSVVRSVLGLATNRCRADSSPVRYIRSTCVWQAILLFIMQSRYLICYIRYLISDIRYLIYYIRYLN